MDSLDRSTEPRQPDRCQFEHPWDLNEVIRRIRYWHDHDQPYLALSHLNRWTEDRPDVAELWYYRAVFCSRLGLRYEESRSWREFLRLDSHNRLLAAALRDRLQWLG